MTENTEKKAPEGSVRLTITGGSGEITTDTEARCYYKNKSYYLLFEEGIDEDGIKNAVVFRSTLKISGEQVSLRRSLKDAKAGSSETVMEMIYRKGTKDGPGHFVEYPTPFGKLLLEIRTDELILEETQDEVTATISYRLMQEGQVASEDRIVIRFCR